MKETWNIVVEYFVAHAVWIALIAIALALIAFAYIAFRRQRTWSPRHPFGVVPQPAPDTIDAQQQAELDQLHASAAANQAVDAGQTHVIAQLQAGQAALQRQSRAPVQWWWGSLLVCCAIAAAMAAFFVPWKHVLHWKRSPQEAMEHLVPTIRKASAFVEKGNKVEAGTSPEFFVRLPWELIPDNHKALWTKQVQDAVKHYEKPGTTIKGVESVTVVGDLRNGKLTYVFPYVYVVLQGATKPVGRRYDCGVPSEWAEPDEVVQWADQLADAMNLSIIRAQNGGGLFLGGRNLPTPSTIPTLPAWTP